LSDEGDREFRVGLSWSFPAERLEEVVRVLEELPETLHEACFYPSGRVEFTIEGEADSFEEARRSLLGPVLATLGGAGLPGEAESVSVTDDFSWEQWNVVGGQLIATRDQGA
jgi:hypothetical protein